MSAGSARPLLVIGAGISGMTSALEAAEAGFEVILVEKESTVGGRVLRNHQYFPKMCPPACGHEINTRRLDRNPLIKVLLDSEVVGGERTSAGWKVKIREGARHVTERCTMCGDCATACPVRLPDPMNAGMNETTAIRAVLPEAWPRRFAISRDHCPQDCTACSEACKYDAIDLSAQEREETLEVGSVVVATGWKPYPLERLGELGGGEHADVISNVQMERLASVSGPTGGRIQRPSNGEAPKRVAFVQCAGSRDVNHLPYCSAVCCLVSLKQALYVKEQLPETEVTIYHIDRRTPGRNEDVLTKVASVDGVKLVKGKVGKVEVLDGALRLRVEDVEANRLIEERFDLVVLATGMVSNLKGQGVALEMLLDDDGFVVEERAKGIFPAGVSRRPEDVASSVRGATGAAAKALMAGRIA